MQSGFAPSDQGLCTGPALPPARPLDRPPAAPRLPIGHPPRPPIGPVARWADTTLSSEGRPWRLSLESGSRLPGCDIESHPTRTRGPVLLHIALPSLAGAGRRLESRDPPPQVSSLPEPRSLKLRKPAKALQFPGGCPGMQIQNSTTKQTVPDATVLPGPPACAQGCPSRSSEIGTSGGTR